MSDHYINMLEKIITILHKFKLDVLFDNFIDNQPRVYTFISMSDHNSLGIKMPFKDKLKQAEKNHEYYLTRKELLIKAKLAAGIPLDKRKKKPVEGENKEC
jgi:hypothetical protein